MPDNAGHDIYLTDLSERDKPWDEHKANSVRVQALYKDSEFDRYVDRMQQCARSLDFALKATDDGELKLRLSSARFCRLRFCPTCQWRRSLMWRARFFQILPKLMADHPTARYVFLTLTVRNCPITELRATIEGMNTAWKRLSQRKAFPAIGWVRSLEVTRNPDDRTAHPHFHVLMMVKPSYFKGHGYIKQDKWRELWQQALRADYLPVVNIKTVKAPKHLEHDERAGLATAIMETLKYGVKESDLLSDVDWLIELTSQLHGMRSIAIGGKMKQYLKDDEPEDLINTDDPDPDFELSETDQHIIFEWKQLVQKYAKVNRTPELGL